MNDADDAPVSRPVSRSLSRAGEAGSRSGGTSSGGKRAVLAALGLIAIVGIVAATSYFGFRSERAGEWSFWLLAGGPVVALTPFALWKARRDGEIRAWMRPRAGDFTLGALAAGLLFAGAYSFAKVVTPNGSPRAIWLARLYLQLGDPNLLRAHPAVLLGGLILVAAAEEIVWRGLATSLLVNILERPRVRDVSGDPGEASGRAIIEPTREDSVTDRSRRAASIAPDESRWAWLGSAVLYSIAYLPTMWALAAPKGLNPVLPMAALGAGLVWSAMAKRLERLTPGIVAHALFDWCIVVIFRLWGESL